MCQENAAKMLVIQVIHSLDIGGMRFSGLIPAFGAGGDSSTLSIPIPAQCWQMRYAQMLSVLAGRRGSTPQTLRCGSHYPFSIKVVEAMPVPRTKIWRIKHVHSSTSLVSGADWRMKAVSYPAITLITARALWK